MLSERTETDAIHFALDELQVFAGRGADLTQILVRCGMASFRSSILDRMLAEELVTIIAPEYAYFVVKVTPLGIQMARHAGGYKGYLETRKESALQKEELERTTAQAAVDGVRANWWAVRVSILGVVVGAAFSILSQMQSANTASELEATKKQVILLQKQVDALTHNKIKP